MSTVLNLNKLKKAGNGQGSLTRDMGGEAGVKDLWRQVMNASVANMEVILNAAKADSEYELTTFIRMIEYQGFNREFYIKHALTKMSVSTFARFAIIGAIRGSNFSKICETCEGMPTDLVTSFSSLGFVKTPKKRDHLTILRNTASIPHWCAYYLLSAEIPGKIPNTCNAAIQFPGAASLPMSKRVRLQHLDFCVNFSKLLPGGSFNMNIYLTAMGNPIPVDVIPQEVLPILEVASMSESYKLTDADLSAYSGAVALRGT